METPNAVQPAERMHETRQCALVYRPAIGQIFYRLSCAVVTVNLTLVSFDLPPSVAVILISYSFGGVVSSVRRVNMLNALSGVGTREGGLKVTVAPAGCPLAVSTSGREKPAEALASMV
jgi:hypothetical protein